MALNAFTSGPGNNVSVAAVPTAVQVVGPTILVTNVGIVTVYGSMGGSTSASVPAVAAISGSPLNSASFPSTATGQSGVAIPPNASVAIATGANTFLWLATTSGVGVVNVVNGT